jgi:hypothetical protein
LAQVSGIALPKMGEGNLAARLSTRRILVRPARGSFDVGAVNGARIWAKARLGRRAVPFVVFLIVIRVSVRSISPTD